MEIWSILSYVGLISQLMDYYALAFVSASRSCLWDTPVITGAPQSCGPCPQGGRGCHGGCCVELPVYFPSPCSSVLCCSC